MSYFTNSRPEMLNYVPLDLRKTLEIGCGFGNFSYSLKQRQNIEAWGVEPSVEAALCAMGKLDNVINAKFDNDIDLPSFYFDCIIFNDVLEHLTDPWNALELSKKFLKQHGFIVCSIPNFRYWENMIEVVYNGSWEYKEEGILDKTHLRFFTYKSIIELFQKSNLDILKIEGINPLNSRKFNLCYHLLKNKLWDMRFLQFAVVAKKKRIISLY
jgi:2-polyprenyl-3-methyl-5-hydroxy-6-metoxy-1,4-benzoquinol methylase